MVDALTILASFPCGCVAYQESEGGSIVWGVRRCDAHVASVTLPKEAEEYFDVGREPAP